MTEEQIQKFRKQIASRAGDLQKDFMDYDDLVKKDFQERNPNGSQPTTFVNWMGWNCMKIAELAIAFENLAASVTDTKSAVDESLDACKKVLNTVE